MIIEEASNPTHPPVRASHFAQAWHFSFRFKTPQKSLHVYIVTGLDIYSYVLMRAGAERRQPARSAFIFT